MTAAVVAPSAASAPGSAAPAFRIRKGQRAEDALAGPVQLPPSVAYIDSPFQLQEYLALLLRADPHDVHRIVRIPETDVSRIFEEDPSGKGKGKDLVDEELHPIDTDVWVYEQLRRIVLDLSTPWLTSLQHDCDKRKNPSTCDAMNAGDWMYLCASHGEEKQCCAIDYIIHTLDGTTALLNSARHFPSRTYIPTTSLRHFGSISRRLSRIFVHTKDHHRDIFDQCEAETSLYARFYALCKMYDLIAIETLPALPAASNSGAPAAAAADAQSQSQSQPQPQPQLSRSDTTVSRKPAAKAPSATAADAAAEATLSPRAPATATLESPSSA